MESSIAGMIILGVLIVAVVLMSQAYVTSTTLLGTAMVESVSIAEERSRTEFSIDSVTTNGGTLIIAATNTGSVPIANYDEMDVFVGSQRFAYATSTQATSTRWIVSNQSTWRPGETRDIVIQGIPSVTATTTVVVSSPGGASNPSALSTPTPTPIPAPSAVTLPCNKFIISTTTTSTVVACSTP